MNIRISELARMTRFSPSGIRFLEEVGVISPNRMENGKYRDFSLIELGQLCMYKYYRELGFSTKEAVSLVGIMSQENLKTHLEMRYEDILQEIEEEKCLLRLIEEQIGSIVLSQSEEPFLRIEKSPALIRLPIWQPETDGDWCFPVPQIAEWMNLFPFVSYCVLFSPDDIQRRNGDLESYWGLAMETWIADILSMPPMLKGEYVPSQECIHIFVEVSDKFTIQSDQLSYVRQYMSHHNLVASNPAINMRIFSEGFDKKHLYLSHLWIPIERQS